MIDDDGFVAGEHHTKYLDQEMTADVIAEAFKQLDTTHRTSHSGDPGTTHDLTVEVDGERFDVFHSGRPI